MNDGSTDGTDELVGRFANEHAWIELLRMPEHRDRTFAAKAVCFNTAFDRHQMRTISAIDECVCHRLLGGCGEIRVVDCDVDAGTRAS